MNWKDTEKKSQWINSCFYPGIAVIEAFPVAGRGTEESHEKPSVGITNLSTQIWTRDLPGTKQEC
jgi:hypothetical protein